MIDGVSMNIQWMNWERATEQIVAEEKEMELVLKKLKKAKATLWPYQFRMDM